MKNQYSIAQRNAIVEANLCKIEELTRKYDKKLKAAHLDEDDVFQQMVLRLIHAVDTYDPDRGELDTHITAQLRYELLEMRKPGGLMDRASISENFRGPKVIPFDILQEDAAFYEMPEVA